MIQFFEVRIKLDSPELKSPENVQEQLGYEIDPTSGVTVVSVSEDIQARRDSDTTPTEGDDNA
jgi:hypothetical protein